MEDKFYKGVIVGAIAGIIKDIPEAIFHHFPRLTEITLWDYAGAIALGRLPVGIPEHCYAFALEVLFSTFVGVIFLNIPLLNRPGNLRLKGIFYGAFIWFLVRMAVLAFNIQALLGESVITSVTNLLISMFYGCMLVCSIHFLDRKSI